MTRNNSKSQKGLKVTFILDATPEYIELPIKHVNQRRLRAIYAFQSGEMTRAASHLLG